MTPQFPLTHMWQLCEQTLYVLRSKFCQRTTKLESKTSKRVAEFPHWAGRGGGEGLDSTGGWKCRIRRHCWSGGVHFSHVVEPFKGCRECIDRVILNLLLLYVVIEAIILSLSASHGKKCNFFRLTEVQEWVTKTSLQLFLHAKKRGEQNPHRNLRNRQPAEVYFSATLLI